MEDSRLCFRCYGCSNLSKRRISLYVHKYGLYTRFEWTRRNEVDERLSTFIGIYTCNRCSSNNVCCAAIIIVRSNVYIVSFFIVMGILILTNRTTTYLLQRCFSTRHQRTSRQTREILVYTERKSEREGESTNERVYDCGEGPDGVSESIFGYVARDAVDVMPSNILWTGIRSMSVWSRKAVLH